MKIAGFGMAIVLTAGLCSTGLAQSAPPVEAFFQTPAFSSASLSPDGRLVAALVPGKAGRKVLAVIDPADLAKARVVAAFSDADVGAVHWISPRRLVFEAADLDAGGGDRRAPGLYAVDIDGASYRQLADREWLRFVSGSRPVGDRVLPVNTFLLAPTRLRDSDYVFAIQFPVPREYRPGDELPDTVLLRLNTRTGQSTVLSRGAPKGTRAWFLDAQDQPRMLATQREGKIGVFHRSDGADWRLLQEFPQLGGEGFLPEHIRRDGKVLVGASHGRDTGALFLFDPVANSFDPQPIVAAEGFDFRGELVVDERDGVSLLGVHVETDGAGTVWLDPHWKAIQAAVDAALPGRTNRIEIAQQPDAPFALVRSFSDVQPPVYLVYDRKRQGLTQIARAKPQIEAELMSPTRFVRFKARDGLEIPMYATVPRAKEGKPLPTVLLVHGGPFVRGHHWEWDAQTQFLASRGYAVLRPEFRGSAGYGFKHFQAGWKQWGLAMQDDLADAARWAIAEGIADPQRICIAGASYGGYAAMMGLAKDGDLFRCGINWIGVTDLELMFTANWTDVTESARRYSLTVTLGDPKRDAERLRATSPLYLTDKIRGPVLLAYGAADLRVPIEHGRKFRAELEKTNKDTEWIVYGDEGHGWSKPENIIDFWTRVEKFLDRNIGSGAR
ncbi:MAG: alpha/beta hydrolase family protein [Betaproteobacteria bacterium]|jgi:dienelactone hydrolase